MVIKNVPSPKFDTANLATVFRDFKHYKIVTKNGNPYRRIYVKGDLNLINTTARHVLGTGAYTITNYFGNWYYVGLKDIVQKSGLPKWESGHPKLEAGSPKNIEGSDLLNRRWLAADYYERRVEDECET